MFVVFEGIEGSGKSTLLSALAGRLRADEREVVETREPGGTPMGDAIRGIFLDRSMTISPLAECFLVNAARAAHVSEVIRPALPCGKIVLCDRFVDSTLAYQGYGRGLDREMLRILCHAATGGLEPDVTLLLDVPIDVSKTRTHARSGSLDRIEGESDAFHERVRRGFLELARSPRHRILDGTLPPAELLELAMSELHPARGAG